MKFISYVDPLYSVSLVMVSSINAEVRTNQRSMLIYLRRYIGLYCMSTFCHGRK